MQTLEQFGQTIKQKYPQYGDIPDAELGQKMLDKYPQYQDLVQKPSFSQRLGGAIKGAVTQDLPNLLKAPLSIADPFVKVAGSAVRSVQATPALFKGNLQQANQTMQKPIFGQKTVQGSTPLQNLGTATQIGSFLGGGEALGALNKGAVRSAAISGGAIGGLQGAGSYVANAEQPTTKGLLGNTALGAATGAVLGAGGAKFTGPKIAKNPTQDVIDLVKPRLTPTEEAAAKAAGRGETKGVFKTTSIKPTAQELEMAKAAQDAGVTPKKSFDQNIQVMKSAQKQSADAVRSGLKDSPAIWNKNELKGVLNKVEKPISLTQPDLPIADKLKSGILQLVDKAQKNPAGILDVRQQFDKLVEKNFGTNIFAKTDPKGILVRNYRNALNDFAESKVPNGKLPNGQTYKSEMRKQTLLYNAIDNLAEKSAKVGESAHPLYGHALNFAKKHPFVTGAAVYGAEKAVKRLGVPVP